MNNIDTVWADNNLVNTLAEGGVVIMPTDTIYGIVGQAKNRETVEKIYSLKKRQPEKPCIILVHDVSVLEKFSVILSAKQISTLNQYWPGPVSIIVDCPNDDLFYLHRGTNTLAFRIPKNENLRLLLSVTGPLIAPSANTEGANPAEDINQAREYFGVGVDLYVDGGYISGKASKLLRLDQDGSVEILRP
jgi:L-threonylcarbamoyladenylate synthase